VDAGQSKIFAGFHDWLVAGGYSDSAVKQYSAAVRLALGLLDKPHSEIDLDADFERVREYLAERPLAASTLATYHKGLAKLAEYVRYCRKEPPPPPAVNWDAYLASFPTWLAEDIRAYVNHRRRAWLPEQWYPSTLNLLSHLTATLRALSGDAPLTDLTDLTPDRWDDYVDRRLAAGLKPATLNRELYDLQGFLRFLADRDRPVCERMLAVTPLDTPDPLPRDVPAPQLRQLQEEIQVEAAATETSARYKGVLDWTWFLLMLHSGLRTGEIRRLCLDDIDLENRQVRIRQSKGLQDRVVYLSPACVEALQAYLAIRGPAVTEHVFIHRHRPLSSGYCNQRLRVYGQRCGVHITGHQLRVE
jgi:integrase